MIGDHIGFISFFCHGHGFVVGWGFARRGYVCGLDAIMGERGKQTGRLGNPIEAAVRKCSRVIPRHGSLHSGNKGPVGITTLLEHKIFGQVQGQVRQSLASRAKHSSPTLMHF